MTFLRSSAIDVAWLERIDWWKHVTRTNAQECWPWPGSIGSHGYGQTWDGVTSRLAHRVAWTLAYGPIPNDMTVDHLCRNRRCCNPSHLRLLTNVENARDNGQGSKTQCPRGHDYDETNTVMDSKGHRRCLTCQQLRNWARADRPNKARGRRVA